MSPFAFSTSRALSVAGACMVAAACSSGSNAGRVDSSAGSVDSVSAPTATAGSDAVPMLRGTISSVTAATVVVKTDTGDVTVKLVQPFHVFDRQPGSTADVKENTFIGVTTVKQPNGAERATEIHVFPDELRGLGEGSRMMTGNTAATGSRMTNGSVAGPMSSSRMSNGTVASTNGGALVVRYAGGSQGVTVPANTPVTKIEPTTKQLATGDHVVMLTKRGDDGSLGASVALLVAK